MIVKQMRILGLCLLLAASAINAAKRPNILFIMSDDHTSQAIGAYGSRLAKLNPTPTIDRLAKEGILFVPEPEDREEIFINYQYIACANLEPELT